jgi:flagellar protein FlaJ
MPSEIINYTENILNLIENIKKAKKEKQPKQKIINLLNEIKEENSKIYFSLQEESQFKVIKEKEIIKQIAPPEVKKYMYLTPKEIKKFLKEINVTRSQIKDFIKKQKQKQKRRATETKLYSIYRGSKYGKFANRIFEPLTLFLTKKYPELFTTLFNSLKLVNITMLSKTYVSVILLNSVLAFFIATLLFFIITLSIIKAIAIGFVFFVLALLITYFYPSSIINTRKKRIRNEIPFAIVHMAAVAGSGTQPINTFILLLESGEYKELNKEFKKILNYVNIFGYNLSTALKAVAKTTPSPEFRELLNGIVSTIETGGNLRSYLDGKSIDALSTYKMERQKYLETLSTYSDIYTAILVAAPLLLITVLTIINVIGGNIGGLSVAKIATIGTFVLLPLLNIGFIIFLNVTQPEI